MLLPQPQIGGVAGVLFWFLGASALVVFLFTTGLGPLLLWIAVVGAVLLVVYFALSRTLFRLKRGAR